MIILSIIKVIWHWKESLRDDLVSKMIKGLNGRQILAGFTKNQIGDFYRGFTMRQ